MGKALVSPLVLGCPSSSDRYDVEVPFWEGVTEQTTSEHLPSRNHGPTAGRPSSEEKNLGSRGGTGASSASSGSSRGFIGLSYFEPNSSQGRSLA